ncbi:MAG: hypothetical protein ACI4JB_08280 [Porcipelethomonas sp.]
MEKSEKIIEFQKKLLKLIQRYESAARSLLECDIDRIKFLVDEREEIIRKIDRVTKEILVLCPENSPQMLAFKNLCDRDSLTDDLKEVFDLRQQFNAFAARAHSMDQQIIERIQITRDSLLQKIKENNAGQVAKAAKFYSAGLTQGKNIYFPENKRKI